MTRRLINYCCGGLGNRLKPLASCAVLARSTNRELQICWEPALRLLSPFETLFSNPIPQIASAEFPKMQNVSVCSNADYIKWEKDLNGHTGLYELSQRVGVTPFEDINSLLASDIETVVVYSNDYLPNSDEASCRRFIKTLTPLPAIQEKFSRFKEEYGIHKQVIGIHARGTDFEAGGTTSVSYIDAIRSILNDNKDLKIFLCSDSKE